MIGIVFNWNHFEMRLLNLRINFLIYSGLFVLILVVFLLFLLSLRFSQISSQAFFRWFTVFPVITAFHSYCLSHHVFDQVNLWPAWVKFETAIFWQCSPGTEETWHLYLLYHRPQINSLSDWSSNTFTTMLKSSMFTSSPPGLSPLKNDFLSYSICGGEVG